MRKAIRAGDRQWAHDIAERIMTLNNDALGTGYYYSVEILGATNGLLVFRGKMDGKKVVEVEKLGTVYLDANIGMTKQELEKAISKEEDFIYELVRH